MMKWRISRGQEPLRVRMKGEELEEVKELKYLELTACASI